MIMFFIKTMKDIPIERDVQKFTSWSKELLSMEKPICFW
jgi:hypothetical protein